MKKLACCLVALVALSSPSPEARADDQVEYTFCSFEWRADNAWTRPGDIWVGSQPFPWQLWADMTHRQQTDARQAFVDHIRNVDGETAGGRLAATSVSCTNTSEGHSIEDAIEKVQDAVEYQAGYFQEKGAKGIISQWSPQGMPVGAHLAKQEDAAREAQRQEAARQTAAKNQQIQDQAARDMEAAKAKRQKFLDDIKAREAACRAEGRTTCPGVGSDQ